MSAILAASRHSVAPSGRHPHPSRFATERSAGRQAIEKSIELRDIGHLRDRTANPLSGGVRQRALVARKRLCAGHLDDSILDSMFRVRARHWDGPDDSPRYVFDLKESIL